MAKENSKRVALRLIVKVMVLAVVCAFVWVLFASLPNRAREASEAASFDVADMLPGDYRLVEWQKKPLYIIYRKPEWEAALQSSDATLLQDARSSHSTQPADAINALRSATPGWFVTLGLGTGTGCSLQYSEPSVEESGAGGFIDGCDQSRYDLAGRVFTDQQARRNTVIPDWSLTDGMIVVGGDRQRLQ